MFRDQTDQVTEDQGVTHELKDDKVIDTQEGFSSKTLRGQQRIRVRDYFQNLIDIVVVTEEVVVENFSQGNSV